MGHGHDRMYGTPSLMATDQVQESCSPCHARRHRVPNDHRSSFRLAILARGRENRRYWYGDSYRRKKRERNGRASTCILQSGGKVRSSEKHTVMAQEPSCITSASRLRSAHRVSLRVERHFTPERTHGDIKCQIQAAERPTLGSNVRCHGTC